MATKIAPQAVVDPEAILEDGVTIGPFCLVGPHVRIGQGCRLISHVTISGHTILGEHNVIYPNAVLGAEPQDISYDGSATRLEIGDHNVFREGVTVNRATTKEQGVTVIGNHNYFMACSHMAHDCRIGNHVLMANGVLLGGHTHVHDRAVLSGNVAVHHYTTVGRYSFVGGLSRIVHDVPPYMLVDGNPSSVRCVNSVGLKRHGFTAEGISSLSEAHRLIYRARMSLPHATEILVNHQHINKHVEILLDFIAWQREGLNGRQRQPCKSVSQAA